MVELSCGLSTALLLAYRFVWPGQGSAQLSFGGSRPTTRRHPPGYKTFTKRLDSSTASNLFEDLAMFRQAYLLLLLLSPALAFARDVRDTPSPALTSVPELSAGFDLLYEQKFSQARDVFARWESRNPEKPFGEVALAATYLFEELSHQGVLTSEFFLDDKKFLRG